MDYTFLRHALVRLCDQCRVETGLASKDLYSMFWTFNYWIIHADQYYFVRSASLLACTYFELLPNPMTVEAPDIQTHEIRRMTRKLLVRMMLTARPEPYEGKEVVPAGYNAFAQCVKGAIQQLS